MSVGAGKALRKLGAMCCLHSPSAVPPSLSHIYHLPMLSSASLFVPHIRCRLAIPKFTDTSAPLDLKTRLLLSQFMIVTGQFSDQMTFESSITPVITSPRV